MACTFRKPILHIAVIQIQVKLLDALPPSLWLAGWVVVLKYMTMSEEDWHMGHGIEEQSDPSVHNCSTSCPLGFGL
jgi:hypothetical protein